MRKRSLERSLEASTQVETLPKLHFINVRAAKNNNWN